MRSLRPSSSGFFGATLFALAAVAWAAPAAPASERPSGEAVGSDSATVAVSAGTIHLVDDGRTIENGTILIKKGRITAVGSALAIPMGASVVDYGPEAVIVPGLVAAYSAYASGAPSTRTASPGLRAIDAFDRFGTYGSAISGGVTSVYITPAESRLIAGQGAVVKLAGADLERRILNPRAAIHGAVDSSARNAPGFWEVPIPSSVETGIGYAKPQLPKTTMGALVALDELIAAARAGDTDTEYGFHAIRDLQPLLEAGVPWRMSAVEAREIRGLLRFAQTNDVPLIIDKALEAKGLADEIAAAGASVVFRVPYSPNAAIRDFGKERDDRWPTYDVPAALAAAGVRVAITGSSPRDLLFSANLASAGGLDERIALRAITLTPAEMYACDSRIGSIAPGKDADLCVLNGPPLSGRASVLATWIDGKEVWSAHEGTATVLAVDELHFGDGTVLAPGELLMKDGRIVEVGTRVAHPRGAAVIRGKACMPGMIDAFGHLGLEGSRKVPAVDFALRDIVGPGDAVDRRVARRGITTVVLTPRGSSKSGAPVMAYKPAAEDERQIVGDPVALRLKWTESNRLNSGADVKGLLAKAKAYRDKWAEYEAAMAAWTPPPPEAPEKADEKDDEKKKEEDKADDEKKDDQDKKKKKRKKKDEEEELEPDPITGVWQAEIASAEDEDAVTLKLRLIFEAGSGSGDVTGNLRCAAVSDELVEIEGHWDREAKQLGLRGLGSRGWVTVQAEPKKQKLEGLVVVGEARYELSAARTSKEVVVARRTERRKPEPPPKVKEPKGKPKEPKVDSKLEPLRSAMAGKATVVVEVERDDEILDCVATFEECGIRPVLFGASGAHKVVDQLVGRVAGVLLSPAVLQYDPKRGTDYRTPYSDYQNAGIPVAFHSGAEEGAAGLPVAAAYAVAQGMSPGGALRALTWDAARMMSIDDRVGRLESGLDADVLLLDHAPFEPGTTVLRAWVNGQEVPQP